MIYRLGLCQASLTNEKFVTSLIWTILPTPKHLGKTLNATVRADKSEQNFFHQSVSF